MATKKAAPAEKPQPARAEIEKRAREIYENRVAKNLPGDAESDWLQAEKELRSGKKK